MRWSHLLILLCVAVICVLSAFTETWKPSEKAQLFYDRQLDSFQHAVLRLQQVLLANGDNAALKKQFFECRNQYKKVEFLVDVFDPFKSRVVNGADLLILEEENPRDSAKPHGLQVIEGLLYAARQDKVKLKLELTTLLSSIERLRDDPDRVYYFADERVWQAMQLGVYRIISLGITGFDVPFSGHALPEAASVLGAIDEVSSCYGKGVVDTLMQRGHQLLTKAAGYARAHTDFNTFDRAVFIRDYLNPVSAWLSIAAVQYSGKGNNRQPLNPAAKGLFATDILDISFFSPNSKFQPTADRVALGKRLFYDPTLSGDGSRSCASCHQPERAFTDGLTKPTGIDGSKILPRNTPTLWNSAFQTRQFYDSRTETLENQLSAVVHNADEMKGSLRASIGKLLADDAYSSLFARAYPQEAIAVTEYDIANAISSYVRSLTGLNSRFDRYIRRETDSFSQGERNGFNLFMGKAKCGTCHFAPVFNGLTPPLYQETESEILAVPATRDRLAMLDADKGKGGFTRVPYHNYAFRTQTVRNVALTAPYMHNGVFNTLEEVVDFYNDGGGAGRGIDLSTQTLPAEKLHLTPKEKKDIVDFLKTLTDTVVRK